MPTWFETHPGLILLASALLAVGLMARRPGRKVRRPNVSRKREGATRSGRSAEAAAGTLPFAATCEAIFLRRTEGTSRPFGGPGEAEDPSAAVLPFDERSRLERLFRQAGYSDAQVAKLIERGDALRRAA